MPGDGEGGQPGSVNSIIPGHDPWAQSARWAMTRCLHRPRAALGPGEVFFSGEWLESCQLCPGPAQLHPGSSLELGSEGLGCRMLTTGSVPHSLCVRGEGAASQLSVFQNTLPFHSFQTGFTLKLCWKHLGLGRFFSGEDFILWAWE